MCLNRGNCYKIILMEKKTCSKRLNRLNNCVYEKKTQIPQGVVCPFPEAMYMYMTIIFIHLILGKGEQKLINGQGHMTTLAAMPIYGIKDI